jgi:hypothetical protein
MALPCHPGRPPGLPDCNDDFPLLSTTTYHYNHLKHYPRLRAQYSGLSTTIADDTTLSTTVKHFKKRLDKITKHFKASMDTITQAMSDILSQVQCDMHEETSSARPKRHTIVPSPSTSRQRQSPP